MSTLTINDALKAKGVEATEVETVKNGITCKGYQIDTGNERIRPVIYFSEGETVDAFVERALKIVERPAPDFDVDSLITRERMLQNSFLCLQKKGKENIIKRSFLNLEIYVRMSVDTGDSTDIATIKITRQMLEMVGVMEDELFEAAKKNSMAKAKIFSMAEALGLPEEEMGATSFDVGTYDCKCHGLAVIALTDILHTYAETKSYSGMYLIPSSTEECLILPEEVGDPKMLAVLVDEVNMSTVDPILQLDPVVYRYDDASRTVSIAASYERG